MKKQELASLPPCYNLLRLSAKVEKNNFKEIMNTVFLYDQAIVQEPLP